MAQNGRGNEIILMADARIRRTLKRISFEIIEQNTENEIVIFAGLNKRGYAAARLICDYALKGGLKTAELLNVDANTSDLNSVISTLPDLTGKRVVLVDDVIFSGRTMLRALSAILGKGEPHKIQMAVLVDRGHRLYPIEPTFVGLYHPTKLKEHVHVDFPEDLNEMKVVLESDYGNS